MIGYAFLNQWLLPDKTELTESSTITANTQAVAKFEPVGNYDDKVVSSETSATGWTRGGKLVTYSPDYTFYTWLNAVGTIAKYEGEEITDKIPLVVLENNGTNYMLEYDEGEYEVVEAGILFGNTEKTTVNSAYSKAKVMRLEKNNGHGQFTASSMGTANESYARGYVMYKDHNDNHKIKVIYSK